MKTEHLVHVFMVMQYKMGRQFPMQWHNFYAIKFTEIVYVCMKAIWLRF